jgi:hypothetical protein
VNAPAQAIVTATYNSATDAHWRSRVGTASAGMAPGAAAGVSPCAWTTTDAKHIKVATTTTATATLKGPVTLLSHELAWVTHTPPSTL